MPWLKVLAAVATLVGLVAVAGINCSGAPGGNIIKGTITAGLPTTDASQTCSNYKIEAASVTVKNESGTVIGTTTTSSNTVPVPTPMPASEDADIKARNEKGNGLTPEEHADLAANFAALEAQLGVCITDFKVTVPRAKFYTMTIGTHSAPTYSFDQMQQMGWKIDLSLGQ